MCGRVEGSMLSFFFQGFAPRKWSEQSKNRFSSYSFTSRWPPMRHATMLARSGKCIQRTNEKVPYQNLYYYFPPLALTDPRGQLRDASARRRGPLLEFWPTEARPKPTDAEPKPTNAEPKPTEAEPKPKRIQGSQGGRQASRLANPASRQPYMS